MSGDAGTIQSISHYHSTGFLRPRKHVFPVDYHVEMPVERLAVGTQAAYLVGAEAPESAIRLGYGRYRIRGGTQMIVLEPDHRLFIAPADDCTFEYACGQARLTAPDNGTEFVPAGVKTRLPAIETGTGIEALFNTVSALCSAPGETSPYRSHPLFRDIPPDIILSHGCSCMSPVAGGSPIHMQLPPDLRFLFAAAPLAYYLGASVEIGKLPGIEACGRSIGLPDMYRQFERWAGKMLSHTFQADCAVRSEAVTGHKLQGIDVQSITGYAPEELMLMTMADRFQVYRRMLSGHHAFNQWHMASYVEPVASSVEILPFLMRSLSAIYAPKSTPVTERDVISLSVANFRKQQAGPFRGDDDTDNAIVYPSLYNAQSQHWFSEGYPVDAALSGIAALKNGRSYVRSRLQPEVCIVCNEPSMDREVQFLKELLAGVARIEVRTYPGRDDLLHTFTEGFDIVHYAGHSDRHGLKCRDGAADISSVDTCNVPVFFFNSCASHLQGARLVEKGAVCGITTMFRLLDEAAIDVCSGFYRMLARGYPIMTSYLGARECSIAGKEYLLIGDGFYRVFDGGNSLLPFYKLSRNSLGFSIQCKMPGPEKGLIIRTDDGRAIADTGFELTGVKAEDLAGLDGGLDGMCIYSSAIYDSVGDAVKAALIDLRREVMAPRGKREAIGGCRKRA